MPGLGLYNIISFRIHSERNFSSLWVWAALGLETCPGGGKTGGPSPGPFGGMFLTPPLHSPVSISHFSKVGFRGRRDERKDTASHGGYGSHLVMGLPECDKYTKPHFFSWGALRELLWKPSHRTLEDDFSLFSDCDGFTHPHTSCRHPLLVLWLFRVEFFTKWLLGFLHVVPIWLVRNTYIFPPSLELTQLASKPVLSLHIGLPEIFPGGV